MALPVVDDHKVWNCSLFVYNIPLFHTFLGNYFTLFQKLNQPEKTWEKIANCKCQINRCLSAF